jgi:hypothetical protein
MTIRLLKKSQDDDKFDESGRSTSSETSSEVTPQHIETNMALPSRTSSFKKADSPRPKRPSITFCEKVEVTPIVPTSKLWLRTKDYERIIANVFDIVDQVKEGRTKSCTRGLENIHKDNTALHDAWDAVLDVQETQRETGVYNDEELSNIYKLTSANCRLEANFRARQDEKEAMEYLNSTT